MSTKLGLNAKIYRNTGTYGTPTWTLMNNVRDLTLADTMDSADVTTRGSDGYKEEEPTLRGLEISFDMVNKAGDADVAAIRTAYTTRATIDLNVLDGLIATSGSAGVRARFKVHSFERTQALNEAQMFNVVIKPAVDENPPVDVTI